ncbi:MAG: CAP domain-containing protein, partial [Hyphomicrobiaceae bacterium]
MLRMIVAFTTAMLMTGCGMSQSSVSTGLFEGTTDTAAMVSQRQQAALGGEPGEQRTQRASSSRRLASLDDRAPRGSYDRAPRGALADRDYHRTALDAEQARNAINAYRRKHGLKPLTLNATLTAAAKAHSRDLAKWDRISHFGSDGSNPWDRVKRAGYAAGLAAENVGTGQVSFAEVLKGWEESPGHNKNLLLRNATHMGIALVHNDKTE